MLANEVLPKVDVKVDVVAFNSFRFVLSGQTWLISMIDRTVELSLLGIALRFKLSRIPPPFFDAAL